MAGLSGLLLVALVSCATGAPVYMKSAAPSAPPSTPSAPPTPSAPESPEEVWLRESLEWAHKVLEGAEKEHELSNGTSMLSSLLHLTATLRPMTPKNRKHLERMAKTPPLDARGESDDNDAGAANSTHDRRRAFRVHEKKWCYACKCQICPAYATAVFVQGKAGPNPTAPSPPWNKELKPADVCPPIVPNPAIYLAWAQTIAPIPLLPVGFSYVEKWKLTGWLNPIYLPRKCMIDAGWEPPFLMARLLMAAAGLAMDPCTRKCWQDYGCWKCGGEFGMWVDGYPWTLDEYEMMNVPANSYYWSRSFGAIDNTPYRLGYGMDKTSQEEWSKQVRTERGCTGACTPTPLSPTKYANVAELSANALAVMDPMALVPTPGRRLGANGTAAGGGGNGLNGAATPGGSVTGGA